MSNNPGLAMNIVIKGNKVWLEISTTRTTVCCVEKGGDMDVSNKG